MLVAVLSILFGVLQVAETGTIIGLVKLPGGKPGQSARVVLLPPKYTEVWNRQVQQRLDNYWEMFKPEFAVNREKIADFNRLAQAEALRYVIATMRRDLGDGVSKYLKETSSNGQFEYRGIPFGSYQLIVQAAANAEDITWSRIVDVQTQIPIFVDLGSPVS